MKNKLILIFCFILVIGTIVLKYISYERSIISSNKERFDTQQAVEEPQAVYLVSKDGQQLLQKDLQQHPEVLVVSTWRDPM